MTSLIKKSILKFLTQFTSNLTPDDIQLSSLKGEAEVRNLELSTSALQNLLNIPTWLKVIVKTNILRIYRIFRSITRRLIM